jgi:hypothetical protein
MRKLKAIVLSVAAVATLVAAPATFVKADQANPQTGPVANTDVKGLTNTTAALSCSRQSAANAAGQDIFLSTANPRTYSGTAWTDVECTGTTFRLKAGERALVVANISAETDCNGSTPTNGQWCEGRALLNGVEGRPVAAEPDSFAFDSVAGGASNWQAHSFQRGWEVRCGLANGCQYKFVAQTKMHNTTVTGMWLDEVAAHIRVTVGGPAAL